LSAWISFVVFSAILVATFFLRVPRSFYPDCYIAISGDAVINIVLGLFVCLGFVIQKQVLGKVFFKKYKKFELTPRFNKITWKFTFKVCLVMWALGFLINYLLELLLTSLFEFSFKNFDDLNMVYNNLQIISDNKISILVLTGTVFIIGIFLNIMMLKYFVEKYATITEKIETEIKH
jgi:hypothetical protein